LECPQWWPLADGEPIGEQRAQELMRYLRTVAPAAVDQARAHLATIASDAQISTHAITTAALAKQSLSEGMRDMSIGVVSATCSIVGHCVPAVGSRGGSPDRTSVLGSRRR